MGEVEASLCLKESWASDCGRGSDGTCRRQLSVVGQLCTVVGHTLLGRHEEMWPERSITTRFVELVGSH